MTRSGTRNDSGRDGPHNRKKQGNRVIYEQKLTKYQICDKIRHEIHKELKDDR